MAEFNELLKVLRREVPSRPVLFEFYLNERLYRRACGKKYDVSTPYATMQTMVRSFAYYGYDYATVRGSELWFSNGEEQDGRTISLNAGHCIEDRAGLGYDARHSYEDKIVPVEQAYEQFVGKMAVLGGIDMNYLICSSEEEITARCRRILEQTKERGGYALGSGNSIPDYVPDEHYFAMLRAVKEGKW